MKTTLDPWDIIGWLLLGTAAVAVAAVILSLWVMWLRHLLTQQLIRRDWLRTRHVAAPVETGKEQSWGYKHGPQVYKKFVTVSRNENGTLALFFGEGFTWGGKTDQEWATVRDERRYTLISQ